MPPKPYQTRKLTLLATTLLALPTTLHAQPTPQTFEVASIRQNKAGGPQHANTTADGYHLANLSLLLPILKAYPPSTGGDAAYYTNDNILGAPDWLRTDRYDLDAKVSEADLSKWQEPAAQSVMLRAMLQALLTDRCKLAVHRDHRDTSIYTLVVAKSGPKFQPSKPGEPHPGGITMPGGATIVPSHGGQTITFYNASMLALAQVLTNFSGRPVQDRTGLTGTYDFVLQKGAPEPPPADSQPNSSTEPPISIFTSVQDLGLKLEPAKGSVEVLVIDHIERPTSN